MGSDIKELMGSMKPRGKAPYSAGVLDSWIDHAEHDFGLQSSGRIRWLIASTVITAMLQKVVDDKGRCRFSLKGGSLLQHVMGLSSRATSDLDGIIRGDLDDFIERMDEEFISGSWGPLEFVRSDVEEIRVPGKKTYPKRFNVTVSLKNKTWRKVQVEIAPDEGNAGSAQESFAPPSLDGFGIPTPNELVGMAMCYQVAQKIHAVTDLHDPERGYRNDRPRDLVDLVLIKQLSEETGHPTRLDILNAALDIFAVRASEAEAAGRIPRAWPPHVVVYPHWTSDYDAAAASVGLKMKAEDAALLINLWIGEIDASTSVITPIA